MNENAFYATLQPAIFSTESMTTNTTKTFTGESSLTGGIVQAWTATAGILLVKQSKVRETFPYIKNKITLTPKKENKEKQPPLINNKIKLL